MPSQSETEPAGRAWSGTVAVEGKASDDGRLIPADVLQWKLPLVLVHEDRWRTVGRVDKIERDGERIRAFGIFHEGAPEIQPGERPTIMTFQSEVDQRRKDVALFTKAEIRAVIISRRAAWPECSFDA